MLKVLQELHLNAVDGWSRRMVAQKVVKRWTHFSMSRAFACWQALGARKKHLAEVAGALVVLCYHVALVQPPHKQGLWCHIAMVQH